ncbi:hypothetical protein IM753_09235 [Moraxella sp. K127]|uniref:Uncharacterized protein n=1 Tax=Moraxella lacunata TaxID=477 RepID=A0A378QDS8_MORLA|nr:MULTISPECIES: hypothetical protein [Moraxella]MBE9591148.1 hypothetical protein [Moraxella sp. K127]STY98650.1 Uncharacterised protein [Moraxella lacunata]STZ01551.1 Uncharacterised protein [Moraxella lacunata]
MDYSFGAWDLFAFYEYFGKVCQKNKKLQDEQFNILFAIIIVVTILLTPRLSYYLAQYFVAKNQSKICGIVSQINKPSWGHNTFNLENNASNFKLNIYDNLSIDDKVCITYNPNEKWYGYAYVFKLEKQP